MGKTSRPKCGAGSPAAPAAAKIRTTSKVTIGRCTVLPTISTNNQFTRPPKGELPFPAYTRGSDASFAIHTIFSMPVDLAIVPVAGQGTRLLPSTKSQPKEMLPVGRKPVVQYIVEELANSGIRRVLFVTGPGKTSIENHFDINAELVAFLRETGKEELLGELEFERQDLQYFYTRQRRQLGLGHAVLCAKPLVGDQPFVVALGDSIIGRNAQSDIVRRMADEFERVGADAVIATEAVAREEGVQVGITRT